MRRCTRAPSVPPFCPPLRLPNSDRLRHWSLFLFHSFCRFSSTATSLEDEFSGGRHEPARANEGARSTAIAYTGQTRLFQQRSWLMPVFSLGDPISVCPPSFLVALLLLVYSGWPYISKKGGGSWTIATANIAIAIDRLASDLHCSSFRWGIMRQTRSRHARTILALILNGRFRPRLQPIRVVELLQ